MDINAAVGDKAGLSREKIEAALGIKESSNLSERERIALEYADRVSATPVGVPDEFFANLQRLFSEREIVELTAHVAHENYNAKSNRPLRVEADRRKPGHMGASRSKGGRGGGGLTPGR